jgi:nitroimidazol reductase NimA-like FMN-containing flavoprotein (pyridoxamine 5'-phosphate oxidase superfamily)
MTPISPATPGEDGAAETAEANGSGTAVRPRVRHVGDVARRVTRRRTELGLSTTDLAKRAGMDPWYLAYFEQSSDTALSVGALRRLAIALDTTIVALEGGQGDRPPGAGRAGPHPTLESLTPEQCEEHLAGGGVGRIILSTGSGPVALPVNFVFADGNVMFRTSDAVLARVSGIVAFEVDHIDDAMSEGWSVLVRGHARPIQLPDERLAAASAAIEPWAGGERPNVVRIAPFEMTGRSIVQSQCEESGVTGHQHKSSHRYEEERRTS